jgi:ABC-type transporter Mla subunit MlaD
MRFERDDAKIGLLVFIAVAMFMALVFHRTLTAMVRKEAVIQVRLEDVSDLEEGTSVQLQGRRVGQVNQIVLRRDGVHYSFLATLGIGRRIVLWKGTKAVVASKGLGSTFVDLVLPPPEKRQEILEANAVLPGETGASLGTLIEAIQAFVENLNSSLDDLKDHLKTKGLGALLDHPSVRKVLVDLDATMIEFKKVAVRSNALVKQGQGSVESMDRSLASLEKTTATVEGLLNKRSGDIDGLIGNLASVMKELQGLSTDMNKLVKDGGPEMEASLKALHRNLLATEELLEILKNKPSRVVWGTPSAGEKEAARKRAEAARQKDETKPEAAPPTP